MENNEKITTNRTPITSSEAMDEAIQKSEKQEQLYSIALFDILGFSNFVENNGNCVVLELYHKLIDLIHQMESNYGRNGNFSGSVVPVPISDDWKSNQLIADANGYIHVCHFSDTFIIYVNYLFERTSWWLLDSFYEPHPLLLGKIGTEYCPLFYQEHHIYLSFLQICMEFFCEAIRAGIPLRGCVSTGMATMDKHQAIYFGRPLVEAARGEQAQDAIGIAFGKSFNNYHPVYNRYFIPYFDHMKKNEEKTDFLSPMVLDWPRFWRGHHEFKDLSIADHINKMNKNSAFSSYYDKAIKFTNYSKQYEDWSERIDYEGGVDIIDYYNRVEKWYKGLE